MKRGYLLPPGCKDLSDALKLKQQQVQSLLHHLPELSGGHDTAPKPWKPATPLPPIKGQIFIPPHTTVRKLAALLEKRPFQIIGDLMQLGMFATVDFLLDFKTISRVARMHGFTAIRG